MRTRTIIMAVVTGIGFLAGCTRGEVSTEIDETIPPEIDEGIRDAYDTYLKNIALARKKRGVVSQKIATIDDPKIRMACLRRCAERYLSIDPEMIELLYRGWYLYDVIHDGLYAADAGVLFGESKETVLDDQLKLLAYVRKHARKLKAAVQAMPTGAEGNMIKDGGAYAAYLDAEGGYNAVAAAYEMYLLKMERVDLLYDIRGLTDEAKARLKKRFEDFLGRPMRTPEQCIKDRKNRRATEFSRISHSADKSSGTW
jgi:hypothetical protein